MIRNKSKRPHQDPLFGIQLLTHNKKWVWYKIHRKSTDKYSSKLEHQCLSRCELKVKEIFRKLNESGNYRVVHMCEIRYDITATKESLWHVS